MKKICKTLLAISIASTLTSSANALSIDQTSAVINATGYKTEKKAAVDMIFQDFFIKFPKTEGSLEEILVGAKAIVRLNSVDTNRNPVRNKTLREKLFANFNGAEVNGEIKEVKGDESKGTIISDIKMNGVIKRISMPYTISGGKLVASATINIVEDFIAGDAFDIFENDAHVRRVHGNKSWPEVKIGFEINVK